MSDMTGNPNFAEHLIDSPDARSVPAMLAALAYEQRTANLIASMHVFDLYENTEHLMPEVAKEIATRLGHGDTDE